MRWSELPLNPSAATLRWFAVCGAALLAALASVQMLLYDNRFLASLLAGLALFAGALALFAARALRPVFVAMIVVSFPLNWLVLHVLLALVFYCLFTPLALWFRLIRRDALARQLERDRVSYWIAKPSTDDVRSYFRQ